MEEFNKRAILEVLGTAGAIAAGAILVRLYSKHKETSYDEE